MNAEQHSPVADPHVTPQIETPNSEKSSPITPGLTVQRDRTESLFIHVLLTYIETPRGGIDPGELNAGQSSPTPHPASCPAMLAIRTAGHRSSSTKLYVWDSLLAEHPDILIGLEKHSNCGTVLSTSAISANTKSPRCGKPRNHVLHKHTEQPQPGYLPLARNFSARFLRSRRPPPHSPTTNKRLPHHKYLQESPRDRGPLALSGSNRMQNRPF